MMSFEKKCQKSRQILKSSSSGMRLIWVKYVRPRSVSSLSIITCSFGSITFVRSSMKSTWFFKTDEMAIASYFAKLSKPVWFFVFWTFWNSSTKLRPFVVV